MTIIDRRSVISGSLALAGLGSVAVAAPKTPIPVIFHTDIGNDVDDTWALLLLLRRPELDLKLVVTEGSNAVYRGRLTARLLALAGRTDVKLAIGADGRDDPGAQSDWVGDYRLSDYPQAASTDGAQAIIDLISASATPVTVITVGPATTLAAALKRRPAIARRARFVGMEGAVRVGYGGAPKPEPEYNVRIDPAALQAVFDADWLDCAITPLDTCGLVVIDGDDYRKVFTSTDPFARACVDNTRVWLRDADWMPRDFDISRQSSTQFDAVAVVMACDESDLVMEPLKLTVKPDGMTVIDPAGRPVRVASAWKDLAGFKARMVAALTRAGT
jgi:inosine-uridine nucleoside N-ribohydrolase